MATAIELSTNEIHSLCQRYLQIKNHNLDDTDAETNSHNFEVLSYKLKPTSDAPAGYLGSHLFLTIDIQVKNAKDEQQLKKLCFFSKAAPNGVATHMQYIEEFGVFKKEIDVYKNVVPHLQQAVKAEVAPKCYYADNNLLVFENLADLGYHMGAGRDGILNYEHLHCVVKSLAALHAGSIIYEQRAGKKITELHAKSVVENSYPLNVPANHMRNVNFNNANTVLKEFIKHMPKYKQNLDHILSNFTPQMRRIFELVQASTKHHNVFSHGDLWANNVMFQYGKYGQTPLQARFVDFQLARYAPPILDLITVLTIPTSRQFRAKYLNELLSDYYRFLSEFVKREDLNLNDFITESQFYESVEEYRICGLIESALFCHLVILPTEMTQQLTNSADGFSDFFDRRRVEICMAAFEKDALYRERLTDILEDFVDNFVLKTK